MNQILRLTIATMAIAFVNFPTTVPAQVAAVQIKLTENQIEGFIAAQKAMSAVLEKMQGTAFSDQAFAKYKAERDAVTKKHGFKDFAEYEAVATNIFIVIAGNRPGDESVHRPADGDQERDQGRKGRQNNSEQ
jgi:hypothetical protein